MVTKADEMTVMRAMYNTRLKIIIEKLNPCSMIVQTSVYIESTKSNFLLTSGLVYTNVGCIVFTFHLIL